MGRLIYGNHDAEVEIEDRTLAHLKIVMIAKLRRTEPFLFSWTHDASDGSGRSAIWIHPAVALHFRFHGNRQPELNREWLESLMLSANSTAGLELQAEPTNDRP